MTHHKRGRAKNARAGCLLCKPHKANGEKGTEGAQTMQERRAREAERGDAYATEPEGPSNDFDDDDPDTHQRHWSDWQEMVTDEEDEMSEITEERLEPPLDCSHGRGPRWRCDDCAHEDWRSRALKAEATIREQRAEVVEWEARYGAACRDIGKLSFMRDSDKALHEAAEAEIELLRELSCDVLDSAHNYEVGPQLPHELLAEAVEYSR